MKNEDLDTMAGVLVGIIIGITILLLWGDVVK
jgi:hypothetical protein